MHSEHDDEVAGFSVAMTSFLLLSLGNLLLFSLPFLEGVLLSCSNKQVPIFVMHMTYIGMCVCVYIYMYVYVDICIRPVGICTRACVSVIMQFTCMCFKYINTTHTPTHFHDCKVTHPSRTAPEKRNC